MFTLEIATGSAAFQGDGTLNLSCEISRILEELAERVRCRLDAPDKDRSFVLQDFNGYTVGQAVYTAIREESRR